MVLTAGIQYMLVDVCFLYTLVGFSALRCLSEKQPSTILGEIAASGSACMCLLCFYSFNECAGLKRVTDGGSTTELFMGPGLWCD